LTKCRDLAEKIVADPSGLPDNRRTASMETPHHGGALLALHQFVSPKSPLAVCVTPLISATGSR